MAKKISFTIRLDEDDWDDSLNGWLCSALDVPSASIEQARDGRGRVVPLEQLKIETGPARLTWIGSGKPALISVSIVLKEELSLTSNEQFWKRLAIVVPIITGVISGIAGYVTRPGPNARHTLHLNVYPNDLEQSGLPKAKISLNSRDASTPVEHKIDSDMLVNVDVSKAVDFATRLSEGYSAIRSAAASSAAEIDASLGKFDALARAFASNICSGGGSGVPPVGVPSLQAPVFALKNQLQNTGVKLREAAAIRVEPPR